MHAEHLLSMPIMPELLSYSGITRAACWVSADAAVKTVVIANNFKASCRTWVVYL